MPTSERPILVTGSAGFIGSHVCEALLARGERVVGIDNLEPFYDVDLKRANLARLEAMDGYEHAGADITDPGSISQVFERTKPSGVIHLAAKAGVRPSIADPVGYARTNLLGTSVMLEAAKQAACERFVFASSSSVYGNNEKTPFSETDPVDHPISPYASTKKSGELLCSTHQHLTGMPTACLRFFTVYGPRQRPDLAFMKFMRLMRDGEPIPVFGDGSMSRDFTYIDNIVGGVLAAHDRIDRFGYRIWNLGSDSPTKLSEFIEALGRVTGIEPVIDRRPQPAGDVDRTWADLTRVREELDYSPRYSLEEGLAKQWAWLTEQK